MCHGLLTTVVSRRHSDTPHSVGLLWTSDRSVAEISTWKQVTFTGDRHPWPRRDSNPKSQQMRGGRPRPENAQPAGSALTRCTLGKFILSHSLMKALVLLGWIFVAVIFVVSFTFLSLLRVAVTTAALFLCRNCVSRQVGSVSKENFILWMWYVLTYRY
jgi:hypothetical protein